MRTSHLYVSVAVLALSVGAAQASDSANAPEKIDLNVPLQLASAQNSDSGSMKTATAPYGGSMDSGWYFKARADMGITTYTAKLVGASELGLLGIEADPDPGVTYTVTDSGGNLRAAAGFLKRTYGEGTIGFNVSTGPWYGDFYWRSALTNRRASTESNYNLGIEITDPGNGAAIADIIEITDATTSGKFSRDQFAVTFGRSFMDHWSAYVAYRHSSTRMRASTAEVTTGQITDAQGQQSAYTTDTVAGQTNTVATRVLSRGPAVGVGYSQAFGAQQDHIISAGIGAAYSFAKVRRTMTFAQRTFSTILPDGTETTLPPGTVPLRAPVAIGDSTNSFGFWGNIGYQYYVLPNLSVSLTGDGYRFAYSATVKNANGDPIGKLREISLSGRLGLAYSF